MNAVLVSVLPVLLHLFPALGCPPLPPADEARPVLTVPEKQPPRVVIPPVKKDR